MNSIAEIKSLHRGHWFDESAMRFFGTHIDETVYPSNGGTYFVTSERYDENSPRRYSVRRAYLVGGAAHIETVGEFGEYATGAAAHREARQLAA